MAMNKEKTFLSAVVYTRNSGAVLADFFDKLGRLLEENFERFEIICVNDASHDAVRETVQAAAAKTNCGVYSMVNLSYFQGLEAAMSAGVDLAIGDFVFEFDSCVVDYELQLVMDVYRRALGGYDIVSASNLRQRLSSRLFYKIYNRIAQSQYELETETFRLLSRRAINRVHSMSKSIPYRKALYANCGLKTDLVVYTPTHTLQADRSKQANKYRKDIALTSLILFTEMAYKIATFFALLMMFATLGGVTYTVAVFIAGHPAAGYTTMMLLIAGGFFGIFAILAIVLKYLSVLVGLVFKQQKYIIESVEKITG